MMSKQDKLNELNTLRVAKNLKPLASWKRSNADLDFTIKALKSGAVLKADAPAAKTEPLKSPPLKPKALSLATAGTSYASIIKPLLSTDLNNKEIWAKVLEKKVDADPAKHWYPAWYRSNEARKASK